MKADKRSHAATGLLLVLPLLFWAWLPMAAQKRPID